MFRSQIRWHRVVSHRVPVPQSKDVKNWSKLDQQRRRVSGVLGRPTEFLTRVHFLPSFAFNWPQFKNSSTPRTSRWLARILPWGLHVWLWQSESESGLSAADRTTCLSGPAGGCRCVLNVCKPTSLTPSQPVSPPTEIDGNELCNRRCGLEIWSSVGFGVLSVLGNVKGCWLLPKNLSGSRWRRCGFWWNWRDGCKVGERARNLKSLSVFLFISELLVSLWIEKSLQGNEDVIQNCNTILETVCNCKRDIVFSWVCFSINSFMCCLKLCFRWRYLPKCNQTYLITNYKD